MAGTKKSDDLDQPGVPKQSETAQDDGSLSGKMAQRRFATEMRTEQAAPGAKVHPRILAGICEFDGMPVYPGVCDPGGKELPVSPLYEGVDCRCTYCGKGQEEMMHRTINVYELNSQPGVLTMCCDDYRCEQAHQKRFLGNKTS